MGVQASFKEAARWEDLAARQGYPLAESGLALLYESGRGLPLDYVAAYAWYSRAIADGDKSGAARLKSLTGLMTPRQITQARNYLASLPAPPDNSPSVEEAQISPLPSRTLGAE